MDSAENKVPENLKSRLKESYDAIAPAYNNWTLQHSPLRLVYLDQLLKLLPASDGQVTVLELGCGAGVPVTQKLLSLPNFTVTANDLSSSQIALAKEKLGDDRVVWVEGDMMDLDFADESFDVVLGFYSIIHLPREEQDTMMQNIFKWLKPGGYTLVNFSEMEESGLVMEEWLHEKGWMFWSGWGAGATLEKVKKIGLKVVVGEVKKEKEEVDASFLWLIAQKPIT